MKKREIYLSFFILFTFFASSASSNQTIERKEKGTVIDLDKAKTDLDETFLYSSIYKGIRTIILEINESCLIGKMNKMRVYDPYIIILDSEIAKSVFIFDMNGRFIRKIGRVGPGPGEYSRPADFTVNKEGNIIYIVDGYLRRINKYDLTTGKFIHSITPDSDVRSYNIEFIGGNLIADAYFNKHSDNNYLLRLIQEQTGKIEGHFLNVKEYGKGFSNLSFSHGNVFHLRENGNIVFFQPLMDQVIEISEESVSSLFEFKSKDLITPDNIKAAMDKNPMRYSLDFAQYNRYFMIIDFIEHGNMIQLNYQKGNSVKLILFNKQTKEVSIMQKRWDDLFYINKIISGHPVPAPKIGCFDPHGVYYYYNTSQVSMIKEFASDGVLSPEIDKLEDLKNLEDDANPVIFYYEFND